ncbi:glycosyl hydrolase [Phormidium tenue FACHB-886]|nr:glycosyl hydrolase [Phormidium tenue FACHB-886]
MIALLIGCTQGSPQIIVSPTAQPPAPQQLPGENVAYGQPPGAVATAANLNLTEQDLLQQSWQAYRQRFIQADGRVIDREAGDRSTSEGQAYAMLRAVFMDDRDTFERVLNWGENNLQRRNPDNSPRDRLWAWKWGRTDQGDWRTIDANFASDGDLDVVTALILASRRWGRSDYAELARLKLEDLWNLATVEGASGRRYFLPGPKEVFQTQPNRTYLNPSYLAPYAYRLFAQVDSRHNWRSLIDSSYDVLETAAQLSKVGLPSDWVVWDATTGNFQAATDQRLKSIYSYDAYRVWWRVALDAAWFNEPRAKNFLEKSMQPLRDLWQKQQSIPAQIDLQGVALVNYESTAQYAMMYAALRQIDPTTAEQIRQQKLLTTYRDGFWDGDSAYYSQNLAWFGLFPPTQIADRWVKQ